MQNALREGIAIRFVKKHKILCGAAFVAVAAILYFAVTGYLNGLPSVKLNFYAGSAPGAAYPDASFAVMSDLHYYDVSLGQEGAAFEEDLMSDRKLLLHSDQLLTFAISELSAADADFVLIPGDLTKDGEYANHMAVAEKLKAFTDSGIKVFVTPGNHDIDNPGSVRYEGDQRILVDSVSAGDFADIYADFGFAQAIYRDADSLSYAAEGVPGLWVVSIDTCRYRENAPGETEIVSGKISQRTADWLADILRIAMAEDIAVITMSHHGIVEHWKGQAKLHPDYLTQDYKHIGRMLASHNVRLHFSGHYHALDIAGADFDEKYIYDIETGSLVTYPCPVRYCKLNGGALSVTGDMLGDKIYAGTDFAKTAEDFTKATVAREAFATLKKYGVPDEDAQYIARIIAEGFMAHYAGDEDPAKRPAFEWSRLGLWPRIVYATQAYVADGLWNDLYPADIDVTLNLK